MQEHSGMNIEGECKSYKRNLQQWKDEALPSRFYDPARIFSIYLDSISKIQSVSNATENFLFLNVRRRGKLLTALDKQVSYDVLL